MRVGIALALGVAQCLASLAAAAEERPAGLCPAFVGRVETLDATKTRYAIALFTHDGTQAVSGTLALYHGDDRYDVHFRDATAADPRDRGATPSPVVVQFETPVDVDGASAVTSEPAGCAASEPWGPNSPVTGRIGAVVVGTRQSVDLGATPSNPDDALWMRFRVAASTAAAIVPDPVVREPHVDCARATIPATTGRVVEPRQLEIAGYGGRRVDVLVTLDATAAVVQTRVERSSGSPDVDRGALAAAAGSSFRAAFFHCRPYGGRYIFTADVR